MSRKAVLLWATTAVTMTVAAVYATISLLAEPELEPAAAPEATTNRTEAAAPEASEPVPVAGSIQIKLYVPAGSGQSLATEDQEIQLDDSVQKQVRQVVELLVRRSASFPSGVEVRDVFITSQGVAYVDFSPELVQDHPGGTSAEDATDVPSVCCICTGCFCVSRSPLRSGPARCVSDPGLPRQPTKAAALWAESQHA